MDMFVGQLHFLLSSFPISVNERQALGRLAGSKAELAET